MRLNFTALDSLKCFIIQFVVVYLVHNSHGALKDEQYLDSISCSTKHKISLLPNKTLIIKLSRWPDYHRQLSFLNFQCKFQVIAPRGYAIMAIVQQLHLRTKNMQSSSCRDYIRFEQSDGLEAGPICGEIGENDQSEKPKSLVGSRFFFDPKGILDAQLKFDDSLLEDIQKPFKLEIAFTAYAECTSTSLLTRQVRQCSLSRFQSCISPAFFCDGVINCGYRGDFGSDESDCSSNKSSTKDDKIHLNHDGPIHKVDLGRSNKDLSKSNSVDVDRNTDRFDDVRLGVPVQIFALVSAISGALIVLLVFFVCCCIVRNVSRRNLMQRQSPSQRTIEINLSHSSVPMSHVRAEVSNQGIIVKSPEDLPPSYEAIFPEPVPQKH